MRPVARVRSVLFTTSVHYIPIRVCQIQCQQLMEAVCHCIAVASALVCHNGSPQQLCAHPQNGLPP